MKTFLSLVTRFVSLSVILGALVVQAQVPSLISYQGLVAGGGTNFHGVAQFKFALVNSGASVTFWSNDGTSVAGSEPAAAVPLDVVNGLYSVMLGNVALPNMTAVPPGVFTNVDVRLRVWFNDGIGGSQLLAPDQRITAVGYAMMSANIADGAITADKLAPGAVTTASIADGAVTGSKLGSNQVTSIQLGDSIDLGTDSVTGKLDIYRTSAGTPGISLLGGSSRISTYGSDGLEQIRLWGTGFGEVFLYNSGTNNALAVDLSASGTSGGSLSLNNSNGTTLALLSGANSGAYLYLDNANNNRAVSLTSPVSGGTLSLNNSNGTSRAFLSGNSSGGSLTLYQNDGSTGVFLDGDSSGAGYIDVRGTNGNARIVLDGDAGDNGGQIDVRNSSGATKVRIDGQSTSSAGEISLFDTSGNETVQILAAESTGTGAEMRLYNTSGQARIELDGDFNDGGAILLFGTNNTPKIVLDSDINGDGKITCDVIQINGGSDLSEKFDIEGAEAEPQPGMLVSIDPANPGKLLVSRKPFDKTVAGVISGAGGVRPGLLMGQAGTSADGRLPVALTGRVYCWVDADSAGAVGPGDLITTSATPGHGMKAVVPAQAQGAIIGKAMTALNSGKGLVLVLVSLQ